MKARAIRGFSLAEALIVVAIIGILVGVAIPVFSSQIDNMRRQHDISCVELAFGAAKEEYAYDYGKTNEKSESVSKLPRKTYFYNAATGEALGPSSKKPSGYGQWDQEADYEVSGIPISGVAKDKIIRCVVYNGEVTSAQWGRMGYGALYEEAVGKYSSKTVVLTEDTADERLAADVDVIRAMACEYLGKTKAEILDAVNLPLAYQGRLSNNEGVGLFSYRNQGTSNPQVRGDYSVMTEFGFSGTVADKSTNSYSTSSARAFLSDFMNSGVEAEVMIGKVEYDSEGKANRIKAWINVISYNDVDITIPEELLSIYVSTD